MALLVGGATFVIVVVLFEYRRKYKKNSPGKKSSPKANKERKKIIRAISGDPESFVADLAEIMVPSKEEGKDTPPSSRFEPVVVKSSFIQFDETDSDLSDDETQEILADSSLHEMKEN